MNRHYKQEIKFYYTCRKKTKHTHTQNDQKKIQQAMVKITNYLLLYNVKVFHQDKLQSN